MQLSLFTATTGPRPRVRVECAERCGRRAQSPWKDEHGVFGYYCGPCKETMIKARRLAYYFSYTFTRPGG